MVAWRTKEAKVALFPYSWIGLFWKEFPFTTIILISFSDAKTYHKLKHPFLSLLFLLSLLHSAQNSQIKYLLFNIPSPSPKYPSPPPLITFLFFPPVALHMVKRSHNPKKIKNAWRRGLEKGLCEMVSD